MRNRETTGYVVLGVLKTGAMHGYEIRKFMARHLDGIWNVGTSQLYALLHRLEAEEGLVKGRIWQMDNRLQKRIFTLTPRGEVRFEAWVLSPTRHVRDLRLEFLTKLFFLNYLDLPGGSRLIEAQRALLEDLKHKVEQDHARQTEAFGRVVRGFRRAQFEACLNWLEDEARPFVGDAPQGRRGGSGDAGER